MNIIKLIDKVITIKFYFFYPVYSLAESQILILQSTNIFYIHEFRDQTLDHTFNKNDYLSINLHLGYQKFCYSKSFF